MADEILRIDKGHMKVLASRTFREGFLGKTLEDGLQHLIEQYPEIIPGKQITPGSEEPPRFLMLCREMPVGSWALDFLLVDQHGILTLVEAKLVENPESRRAVIGQIIEYAANAADYWADGKLYEKASSYYAKNSQDLNAAVIGLTKDEDITADEFFEVVEKNLKQGKLRLIILTDQLRPEVRRIIEYLNRETINIEILGLEISFYGDSEESFVLVPRVVGQSVQIANKKKADGKAIAWDYKSLVDAYSDMEESPVSAVRDRLLKIVGWANGAGVMDVGRVQNPSFGVLGKHGSRIMTFWQGGSIYVFFQAHRYGSDLDYRQSFIDSLNELSVFDYTEEDIHNIKDGRTAKEALARLSEQEFDYFMKLLEEFSGQASSTTVT